jgi:hypothetical protein
VFKGRKGVCDACRDWGRRNPLRARCEGCGRTAAVDADRRCRLCWRRDRALARDPSDPRRFFEALTGGHQLYFGGMEHKLALTTPRHRRSPRRIYKPRRARSRALPVRRPIEPTAHRQELLFEVVREFTDLGGRHVPEPAMPELLESLEAVCLEHGLPRGWTRNQTGAVSRALKLLLATQDTPGAPIRASAVRQLRDIPLPVGPTLEVLAAAGFLDDDRTPAVHTWFERKVEILPEPMKAELRIWLGVMRHGSPTAPRRQPRSERTIRNDVYATLPALTAWATSHESLREITRDDVRNILPAGGTHRVQMLKGLRSIFRILRGRGWVFTDPTVHMRIGMPEPRVPVSLDVRTLRRTLTTDDPSAAACASLLIYHGLRPRQLRALRLVNLIDGRLRVDDRTILLAPHARDVLKAYQEYRDRRWPVTSNPHLFVNHITAKGLNPTTGKWINDRLGTTAQALREDRILDEAHAAGGDIRRITDLFGLTVNAALRYTATVDHASFVEHHKRVTNPVDPDHAPVTGTTQRIS